MKKIRLILAVGVGAFLLFSCNNSNTTVNGNNDTIIVNKVMQQMDGSIALHVHEAECYNNEKNPETNTAQWYMVVSKSGRFDVWLNSATTDTTLLGYENKVLLSIHENRFEAQPTINKIINDASVKHPYFKTDSFMGTMYIQDTGLYFVEIISDKILPKNGIIDTTENTKLLSVILTPTTIR